MNKRGRETASRRPVINRNRQRGSAWLTVVGICAGVLLQASEIRFDADGKMSALLLGTNTQNRVNVQNPGQGFFIRTFTGTATEDTRLEKVVCTGDLLIVTGERGLPRLTFTVTRHERSVALKLKRVEGLPKASLAALHVEVNTQASNVKIFSLDYMTQAENRGNALVARFNYLWHREPGDPLGGFALYAADSDSEADEALLELWCGEDLPKPVLGEPWTPARARRWLDDYYAKFKDMTTMIIGAGNEKELYTLTDLAEKKGIKMIYLHTDTWRGEYWPKENSHVHVNEAVFPQGRPDLKRYKAYLAKRGMNLALHTTSGGIGPMDPKRIAGHVDRNLASWCKGQLTEAIDKEASSFTFKPEPGADTPFAPGIFGNGPGLRWHIFETCFIRIDDEIIQVGEFTDLDKPVWTLRHCQRAHGATLAATHAAGTEASGLLSAYGQNFMPDNDSPLLEEIAREFAQFANDIQLDQLEYDAYEIHGSTSWGSQKYSDAVSRHLDHPVISNTSRGCPVASNIELLFSKIRDINQFGYHTVNLSFQLDSHRPATSLLDAWFELSSLVAKGVRRFQILKPEPMFGVTSEILAIHGLTDAMFEAFNLWREVTPLLSDDDVKVMRTNMAPFGNHMQGKDLFQVRKAMDHYEVIPTRVMIRKQGDVPWKVGQEFGPVGPRQFCRPGQMLDLENPYQAQPARFVIRVLSELTEDGVGMAIASSNRAENALVDSYRTGADAAGKSGVSEAAGKPLSQTGKRLQPQAKDITDQRFAHFEQEGEALVMTADNPRGTAVRFEEKLPGWRQEFSMASGHGIAMEIDGDGSGAVVLLQLNGRGVRDYVVKVDFQGTRTIMIPSGETSWADGNWGWRFGAKHFDYEKVSGIRLGFGSIPARTSAKVRISNLRLLADKASKLVNPVIRTGAGSLTVNGEIETGCYLRYEGGEVATVHDRNWKKLKELKVVLDHYVMPAGFAPIRVEVTEDAPQPWLEVQTIVTGNPRLVPMKKQERKL
ncbi:MAG: hypothetical protein WCP12_15505 [bacterium]